MRYGCGAPGACERNGDVLCSWRSERRDRVCEAACKTACCTQGCNSQEQQLCETHPLSAFASEECEHSDSPGADQRKRDPAGIVRLQPGCRTGDVCVDLD